MIEDPFPGGDLPVSIGIAEKLAAVYQHKRIDPDPQPDPGRNMANTDGSLPVDGSDVCAHDLRTVTSMAKGIDQLSAEFGRDCLIGHAVVVGRPVFRHPN